MNFDQAREALFSSYERLIAQPNRKLNQHNGIYQRWEQPIITPDHAPVFWRYDLNEATNPYLMERQGVNATFNAGAIHWKGKYLLVVRVEGNDRKSFFAIAESPNGIDQFRFWDYPITLPQTDDPDTNVYDMRLTRHEDGKIYGLFCTERHDPARPDDPILLAAPR